MQRPDLVLRKAGHAGRAGSGRASPGRCPGPGSLCALAALTSPWQCGQVSVGCITVPHVSWTKTTGGPPGDGTGMEPLLAEERAAALDLLGGGREDSFVAAAATLAGQGDHALALEIISPGLLRYPASAALQDLRRRVLRRLLAQHQQDPFRFLIYAELAGIETGPTR